jgi:hypothetical protein
MGHVLPDNPTIMNVLVFKTSVETPDQIQYLTPKLNALAGQGSWNFDLADCDRILRIVSDSVNPETAIHLINSLGFMCDELED